MILRSPAKLNLFLHVVGRRADGYHDLQTIFQIVDLCDVVSIVSTEDGFISRFPPPTDPVLAALADDQDLTVRAARLLQQASGTTLGAQLHVEKRIPAGGGLGGGSSDAAAVLLGLNRLWQLDWPVGRLLALGLQLGADVPVFIAGHNAWGEGRGERLTTLGLPQRWYLIVHPGVAVSTAKIFQAPDLTRNSPPLDIADYGYAVLRNDCEPVVRRLYPEVARALDWLALRSPARLTGTGSCIFAAFENESKAEQVAAQLPAEWTGFVVRGLQRSPTLF